MAGNLKGPVPAEAVHPTVPPTPRQRQGRWAEQRALRLLEDQGWHLVTRNWGCRWGELDLVCEKPGRLLLVEVKGRRPGSRDGAGSVSLRGRQRRRLGRAWACWLVDHPERATWPVEFVAALVPLPPAAGGVRWLRLEG
jgi:putative endonuclease